MADDAQDSPFQVPMVPHILGGLVERFRSFWIGLGRLETDLLAEKLAGITVRKPIYITGLARSGSTLLHEVIASHRRVVTHQMKDYPMLFTPYWWRKATVNMRPQSPRERVHGDGILVTTESPDSIEEMLWMAFFPDSHNPAQSHVLSADIRNRDFETFYDTHIRKLLLIEQAERYTAKNNYHVTRLAYLKRLYPDARFLIPIRSPEGHIASLARQHRLFSEGHRRFPKSLTLMKRSGHFEFGKLRLPIHVGDPERIRTIQTLWAQGEELRGLAIYWDMIYGYLGRLLTTNTALRSACLVIRYEDLCDSPVKTLENLVNHCDLPVEPDLIHQWAKKIQPRTYQESRYTTAEQEMIRAETRASAQYWGYV